MNKDIEINKNNQNNSNNNQFKVIKSDTDQMKISSQLPNQLPHSPTTNRASSIGLDLIANPQKKKTETKLVNSPLPPKKTNYISQALKESQIDQQDLEATQQKNNDNYDRLSFVSTISSRKSSKKVHHFDLNSNSSLQNDMNTASPKKQEIRSLSESVSKDQMSINTRPNLQTSPRSFEHLPLNNQIPKIIGDRGIQLEIEKPDSVNSLYNKLEQLSSSSSISLGNHQHISETPKTIGEIKKEKQDILYQLDKLRRLGMNVPTRFNMTSDLEEMKGELTKLKKNREIENSIKFSRKALVAISTGIEFLNNKFDPCDLKLDGWSESMHENITEYDEVFEELNDKYSGSTKISPEIKLMLMVGGSAFMFHLTNTMFKSALPGMGDIMKNNPDLMKQFASVALNTMNENVNNGNFNTSNSQKEMNGPVGVEDLLNLDNNSISSSQFEEKMMNSTQMPKQFNLNL